MVPGVRSQEERGEEAKRCLVRKEREKERQGRGQPTVMEIDEPRMRNYSRTYSVDLGRESIGRKSCVTEESDLVPVREHYLQGKVDIYC